MLSFKIGEQGEIAPAGRLDAASAGEAKAYLDRYSESIVLDFRELEYISSAGLGVLVATLKRLNDLGKGIRIVNAGNHIKDLFRYSGLNKIFEME